MNPVAFTIFGLSIKWYSVFIFCGIVISYILITSECINFGIRKDFVSNLFFWCIIMGSFGG